MVKCLKVSHDVYNDALSAVISQHKCDVIVLSVITRKITAWVSFCMKTLKRAIYHMGGTFGGH